MRFQKSVRFAEYPPSVAIAVEIGSGLMKPSLAALVVAVAGSGVVPALLLATDLPDPTCVLLR